MSLPIRNIYCLGRNYAEHARELGNDPSARPLVFMKPASSIVASGGTIVIPRGAGSCHHEVELAFQVGGDARRISPDEAAPLIAGYALALDMTLRDRQNELKKAGWPWEAAKAFETSLPLSEFVAASSIADPGAVELRLEVNGELRQSGSTRQMMLSVTEALAYVSELFQLRAGDLILTGTPAGVGPVVAGDRLVASVPGLMRLEVGVAEEAG